MSERHDLNARPRWDTGVRRCHLYLFFNRCRDCVTMLLWEGDGFVIWYKRLAAVLKLIVK
jgi:hypothetical protein